MAEPKKEETVRDAGTGRYTSLSGKATARSSATGILTTGQKDRIKEAITTANRKVGLFKKK